MSERVKIYYTWDWNHFYCNTALSVHNQHDRFCIWFQFLGLLLEVEFKKGE